MTDDEVVKCLQCDWPILRNEPFSTVFSTGEDGESIEHAGSAHLVCLADLACGVPRAQTQKRYVGRMGMN